MTFDFDLCEYLEVVHQQGSEVMGSGEKLTGYLEGRQSDLSMFLVELWHHWVVHVVYAVIGLSEKKGDI